MRVGIPIETRDSQLKSAMLGVLAAARRPDTSGERHELFALAFDGALESCRGELRAHGVDVIVDVRATGLDGSVAPDARAATVVQTMEHFELEVLLGLTSRLGRDLLARVAALLDAPLLLDCVAVDLASSMARRPLYSGKAIAEIRARGRHRIFGLRPNVFAPEPCSGAGEVVVFEASRVTGRLEVVGERPGNSGTVVLSEAEIVISGGRAMRNGDNFAILERCAEVLGAAVGASRVAVDEGWVPHSMQVGQTGTTVSPRLYIACGISGAAQHFAGMRSSGTVVAINLDRSAAMMQNCDYGIVGDVLEIVPILTRQLKELRRGES